MRIILSVHNSSIPQQQGIGGGWGCYVGGGRGTGGGACRWGLAGMELLGSCKRQVGGPSSSPCTWIQPMCPHWASQLFAHLLGPLLGLPSSSSCPSPTESCQAVTGRPGKYVQAGSRHTGMCGLQKPRSRQRRETSPLLLLPFWAELSSLLPCRKVGNKKLGESRKGRGLVHGGPI